MIDSKRLTAWYNFQARAYSFWRDKYDSPLVQTVSQLVEPLAGGSARHVLDAGCGSGMFTLGLAKLRPLWRVLGIDPSVGLLKIGRQQGSKQKINNASFIEGDVMRLPHEDAAFDVVVAAGLFPNLNDHLAALTELHRVLKPGGHMVIVEFDRATMTTTTKLFFRGMIAAYKTVSMVFRRFRFTDKWNIETSTINSDRFAGHLKEVGLEPKSALREHNHLVFHCVKQES